MVIWLFALTVAYPTCLVPTPDAFKGISVFFGLMVTLGSAGIMNHAMSGLVLIYSRALRPGGSGADWRGGGMVSELNPLHQAGDAPGSRGHPPNAVVVGGKVVNLTRLAGGEGVALPDQGDHRLRCPWRQVHAMLELAARRCTLLNQDEPPLVRQLNLQDWYVEYELQVRMKGICCPPWSRRSCTAHIQDVFNEFGVQIMSPTSSPSRSRRCWWPGNTGISRPRSLLRFPPAVSPHPRHDPKERPGSNAGPLVIGAASVSRLSSPWLPATGRV